MSTSDEMIHALTGAYVTAKMPLVQQELDRQVADGADIAELVGMISDGKGAMAEIGEVATVVPRSLARTMARTASEIPEFAQAAKLLEKPEPGTFLIFISFEDNPGFAAYGYTAMQLRKGARA